MARLPTLELQDDTPTPFVRPGLLSWTRIPVASPGDRSATAARLGDGSSTPTESDGAAGQGGARCEKSS